MVSPAPTIVKRQPESKHGLEMVAGARAPKTAREMTMDAFGPATVRLLHRFFPTTKPKLPAEMQARVDKLDDWRWNVRMVVRLAVILATLGIVLLTVLLGRDETEEAVVDRDRDLDEDDEDPFLDWAVDHLAYNGLVVCGFTLFEKQIPDDVEQTRQLFGEEEARRCWAFREEMTMSWWNQVRGMEELDLERFRDDAQVQSVHWACFDFTVFQASGKSTSCAMGRFLRSLITSTQQRREASIKGKGQVRRPRSKS